MFTPSFALVIKFLCLSLFAFLANPPDVIPTSYALVNRIEGVVYDPHRMPVEKAYVELLNDVDSVIDRTRTNSAGRFTFSGMPPGRYAVKVLPLGTNLMEQTQEVNITDITRIRNDTTYIDINLRYDKRNRESASET